MLKLFLVSVCLIDFVFSASFRNMSHVVGSRQFYQHKMAPPFSPFHLGSTKEIYYKMDGLMGERFNSREINHIRGVMDLIKSKTCLEVFEYDSTKSGLPCEKFIVCITFTKVPHHPLDPTPCTAGRPTQEIFAPAHCFTDGSILHEVMHILGFGHEHQRIDRDCYVEVTGDGLSDPEYADTDYRLDITFPYDVHSVMHYKKSDKLKPAKFMDQNQEFGQDDALTDMDAIALNYLWCDGRHYCDINPVRCQWFRCWIECNKCVVEYIKQCKNCTGSIHN